MSSIFHIITRSDYEKVAETALYQPASLQSEGFIHCSYRDQVLRTVNVHFKGQTDLLLLEIDPAKMQDDVIAEDLYGLNELFPHLYGPLPLSAISAVHQLLQDDSDSFVLPLTLGGAGQ